MSAQQFTDSVLRVIVINERGEYTKLATQLAEMVLADREALRKLQKDIEPMAKQILCPSDNVFSRQLQVIEERLSA